VRGEGKEEGEGGTCSKVLVGIDAPALLTSLLFSAGIQGTLVAYPLVDGRRPPGLPRRFSMTLSFTN